MKYWRLNRTVLMVFVLMWMRLANVGVNGEDLARVDEASSQNETSSLTDGVVTFNYNDNDDDDDEQDENKINRSTSNSNMVVVNVSQFVAKIKGGLKHAQKIANRLNIKLVKQVFEDSNYFLFVQEYVDDSQKLNTHDLENMNPDDNENENVNENNDNVDDHTEIDNTISKQRRDLSQRKTKARLKRSFDSDELDKFKREPEVEWVQQQIPKIRKKRDFLDEDAIAAQKANAQSAEIKFNDPMWSKLWYINPQERPTLSMRIKEAWKLGYSGKGVIVTILDDGLEWDHPDLIKNYDFKASLDINDSDNDPRPRYDRYNYNKHGTRCAGEIAAVADNKICSVGVAYNSRIGGIRMLDGEVTDLVEATALSYNRDYIDIYSASWGPDDDGKTVDGPGYLALKAIEDGIRFGRKGLGSIYVWASGNGGKDDDNCNCDGYTNSIYTISISSATQNGNIPWYSEACSSTIASTFSSGSYEERQIITTDLRKSCTEAHTGTSASAPLAAGIIALTLEANPELSWRDVQHIIVETSRPENLSSTDWQLNGAHRKVSHSFGYGMMDALSMVQLAKKWVNVPPQRKCVIESSKNVHHQKPILIPKGDKLVIELFSTGCKGSKNEINYLEHVQAVISVQSNSRGTLVVYLRSPTGTNSTLLDRRMLDQSTESFNKWPFTTVHMWGEKPQGTWTLEIKNNAKNTTYLNLNLILYGTKESPQKRAIVSEEESTNTGVANVDLTSLIGGQSLSNELNSIASIEQKNKKTKISSKLNKHKLFDSSSSSESGDNMDPRQRPNTKRPSHIMINDNFNKFRKFTKTWKAHSKLTTTVKTSTSTDSNLLMLPDSDARTNNNTDYYSADDETNVGAVEIDDPDDESEHELKPAPVVAPTKSILDYSDANYNDDDYYVNDVNTNELFVKGSNQVDQAAYYDSSISLQHSSMLRNGIQVSHERSSASSSSSSASGYNSSVNSLKFVANKFYSLVMFFALTLFCLYI